MEAREQGSQARGIAMIHAISHRTGLMLAVCLAAFVPLASERASSPAKAPGGVVVPRLRAADRSGAARQVQARNIYGRLPLNFEANIGQVKQGSGTPVKFLSRGAGYTLFLTGDEAVLALRARTRREDRSSVNRQELKGNSASLETRLLPPRASRLPSPSLNPRAGAVLHMKLVGSNAAARVEGEDELAARSNDFVGKNPAGWRKDIPNYARVKYQDVYPGIDLIYYGNQQQLEYDFVVAPGANPNIITLDVGAVLGPSKTAHRDAPLRIDARGDLVLGTRAGEVRFHKPVAYQLIARAPSNLRSDTENREPVEGRYVLKGEHEVGFAVGAYDATRPLVIDPVLSYSTYLGGTSGADYGQAIAVDPAGNAYVTGYTCSTDFPALDPVQTSNASGGCEDAFVTKLNAAGDALVYSTYLGGAGNDVGLGIAVDPAGRAYVAGYTCSIDFPVINPIQAASGGGCTAFVSKLNPAGNALIYSTYLGGSNTDVAQAISADAAGNAYVTGYTLSADFPTSAGAFQTAFGGGSCGAAPLEQKPCADAFVAKLNPAGSALVYSTYLGGSSYDAGQGIAIDGAGNAFVTGFTVSTDFPTANALQSSCSNCALAGADPGQGVSSDAFVTKLNPAGSALAYSTYLGGSGADTGSGIAIDPAGSAYVTGYTTSADFPTMNALQANQAGGYDAFVSKLKADGSALAYSTYLGGSGNDLGLAIAVDPAGIVTIAGETFSEDFPASDAFQPIRDGGFDAFVTRLSAAGDAFVYSSFLGGGSGDQALGVALDRSGSAYVAGITNSADFPTTSVAYQTTCEGGSACAQAGAKAYVVKIDSLDVPAAALSTLNLEFGGEAVDEVSAPQPVILRNLGSQPLVIRKIFTASRRYFAESNGCGAELAPGASCTINVRFTPAVTGQVTGFLVVSDNAWPKGLQFVRLVGSGT
jgi:beta-propeller repeat-containing protein/HYDIN/CFA65/VesB family protein